MRIAIINISEAGLDSARQLQSELNGKCLTRKEVATEWHNYDAFIFIGAMGICVRTIAPLIEDKHKDPAVVCVDSLAQHAVSVLSGHIGGANDLTLRVASILAAAPVVTTQSDCAGLWSLDTLDKRFDWDCISSDMNHVVFHFVNRKPTALLLDVRDEGTYYLESSLPHHVTIVKDLQEVKEGNYELLIVVSPFSKPELNNLSIPFIQYVPKAITVGFGLAHQAEPAATIYQAMRDLIEKAGIVFSKNLRWFTIDVKKDEPFVGLLEQNGFSTTFFTAQQLSQIEVPNPSDTVQKHVGTASVSEAAAILGAGQGRLLVPKAKGTNFTLALAIDPSYLRTDAVPVSVEPQGHIEIVGAGPGDPDLISVRGRRLLEQADLILYAGSLVPRELTNCHKAGAVVRSSASMALEEQCQLMKEFYDRGQLIVRLHTGDPCIFGAIQEQMAFFDQHHMHYHITPGISSFLAAAAELRSQFTIPERTQTIILTRGEGRTPMPEREKLHLLARSQSTMCIFLSAAIVDDVQRELLQEYPEDTPVAACYHLTWPDQRIYRGQLKDLARMVHDNNLTLTTMLVVGEAIDNRSGLSELYNKHFTHLFRKGDQ